MGIYIKDMRMPETIERINRTVDDLKKYPAIIEAERGDDE